MNLWHYLWPWSQQRKDRANKEREVEQRFQQQLKEAKQRQESLKVAADKIRQEREGRQSGATFRSPPHPTGLTHGR